MCQLIKVNIIGMLEVRAERAMGRDVNLVDVFTGKSLVIP
jgi:hypothetical protein